MRWSEGTLPTDRQFTGQRLEAGLGLYDYKARYYDPGIGRFVQPDTVVPRPGNPQSLNRYSYVNNNPLRYTDPSGHCIPGVNCPGMMSGVSAPSDPSPHLRGAAYARWLVHYILSLEQQQAETGGMLDLATSQNNAGFELSTLWLGSGDFPEELDRQLMASAPQMVSNAAGASREFLVTSAEWVVELVLKSEGEHPIVIGENMKRVQAYAQEIDGLTINDFLPEEGWSEPFNQQWIQQMREEGRDIIDIGPDFSRRLRYRIDPTDPLGRPPSPYYGEERRLLLGYERYHRVYERVWKYGGGVPGFDY